MLKKKTGNRIISALLSIVLLTTSIGGVARAEEFTWNDDTKEQATAVYGITDWSLMPKSLRFATKGSFCKANCDEFRNTKAPDTDVENAGKTYDEIVEKMLDDIANTHAFSLLYDAADYKEILLAMACQMNKNGTAWVRNHPGTTAYVYDVCYCGLFLTGTNYETSKSVYQSFQYLFFRYQKAEETYRKKYSEYPSIYSVDDVLKSVIQSVVYGYNSFILRYRSFDNYYSVYSESAASDYYTTILSKVMAGQAVTVDESKNENPNEDGIQVETPTPSGGEGEAPVPTPTPSTTVVTEQADSSVQIPTEKMTNEMFQSFANDVAGMYTAVTVVPGGNSSFSMYNAATIDGGKGAQVGAYRVLFQTVDEYKGINYGQNSIYNSACGPASVCNAFYYLGVGDVSVPDMCTYSVNCGARATSGTDCVTLIKSLANSAQYGSKFTYKVTSSKSEMLACLSSGGAALVHSGATQLFSNGGHFVCAVGVSGSTVTVLDSYWYNSKYTSSYRKSRVTVLGTGVVQVSADDMQASIKTEGYILLYKR